jgi:magnesium-transporting ATPase (P-type)
MDAQPQSVPPKLAPRLSPGVFAVATLVFAVISGAAVLFFFDPTKNHFYPVCQFYLLTGLYCPGCGATRASYQLLHGNFLTALHDNALYVISLIALVARGVWFLKRRYYRQPVRFFIPPNALWTFLVLAIVFVVLRNVPAFSFLAPLK